MFFIGLLNANWHLKYDDDLSSFGNNDVKLAAKAISIPTNKITDRTKCYAEAQKIIIDDLTFFICTSPNVIVFHSNFYIFFHFHMGMDHFFQFAFLDFSLAEKPNHLRH